MLELSISLMNWVNFDLMEMLLVYDGIYFNTTLFTDNSNGDMECIIDLSYLYEGPIIIRVVCELTMDYQLVSKLYNNKS